MAYRSQNSDKTQILESNQKCIFESRCMRYRKDETTKYSKWQSVPTTGHLVAGSGRCRTGRRVLDVRVAHDPGREFLLRFCEARASPAIQSMHLKHIFQFFQRNTCPAQKVKICDRNFKTMKKSQSWPLNRRLNALLNLPLRSSNTECGC